MCVNVCRCELRTSVLDVGLIVLTSLPSSRLFTSPGKPPPSLILSDGTQSLSLSLSHSQDQCFSCIQFLVMTSSKLLSLRFNGGTQWMPFDIVLSPPLNYAFLPCLFNSTPCFPGETWVVVRIAPLLMGLRGNPLRTPSTLPACLLPFYSVSFSGYLMNTSAKDPMGTQTGRR